MKAWRARLESTKAVRWWRARPGTLRFVIRAALLMGAFYAVVYYPYRNGSFPERVLDGYLVMALLLVLISVGCFAVWAVRARDRAPALATGASAGA